MDTLENEIAHRLSQGYRQVSFEQFKTEYAAIGYTFDRTSDVRSIARYMTGNGLDNPTLTLASTLSRQIIGYRPGMSMQGEMVTIRHSEHCEIVCLRLYKGE